MISSFKSGNALYKTYPNNPGNNITVGDSICESSISPVSVFSWLRGDPYTSNQFVYNESEPGIQGHLEALTHLFWMNNGWAGRKTIDVVNDLARCITNWNTDINPLNMMFINLGINDVDNTGFDIEITKANFRTIFNVAPNKTIVNAIPYTDQGLSGDGVHQCDPMIIELNRWLQTQCGQRGFAYCDWYTYSRANSHNAAKFSNQIHPNEGGYIDMAAMIYALIQSKHWI